MSHEPSEVPKGEELPMTKRTLPSRIAGVSATVKEWRRHRIHRGEIAKLRRVREGGSLPAAFWQLVDKYEIRRGKEERMLIALMPALVEHPHSPTRRPGVALGKSGVSSARFERWLRHGKPSAWTETRRLLSRVEGGIDWGSLSALLYAWDDPQRGDKLRRGIARDFYLGDPGSKSQSDHVRTASIDNPNSVDEE